MKKPSIRPSIQKGFSLVELLVVIAVIAIIAAIAIPNIANITQGASDSANRRNAQNLASTASAAVAAGFAGTNTTTGWVSLLSSADGIIVTNAFGQTNGVFRVDGISGAALTNASRYLTNNGNNLIYNPNATN